MGQLLAKVGGTWVPTGNGASGPAGPPGDDGIEIGPTPPVDTDVLWADTTATGTGSYPGWPQFVVHPSGDTTGATDAAAINAALAAHRSVLLAPGMFYVNQPVYLAASKTRLAGSGKNLTTIFQVSGSNIPGVNGIVGYPYGGVSDITVCDLTIDGNKAGNTTGTGIMYAIVNDATVERCRIMNTADKGVHVYLGANFSLIDCELISIGDGTSAVPDGSYAALCCQGTLGTRVIGNRVDGCGDVGILTGGDGFNVVVGNHVEDCHGIGIGLGSGHTVTGGPHVITGNSVNRTTTSTGIDTADACNVTVEGNIVMGAGGDGICHDASGATGGVANAVFSNNSIYNSGAGGINIICNQTTGHTGFTVVGNTINVCGGLGIRLDAGRESTIVGNHIRYVGAGYAFIQLWAGSGGAVVTDCTIQGNVTIDRSTPVSYGIQAAGAGCNYNIITGNNLRNVGSKMDGVFGAGSIIKDNLGVP
jgi:hypothetical protein